MSCLSSVGGGPSDLVPEEVRFWIDAVESRR
jgi:hypothetical protein